MSQIITRSEDVDARGEHLVEVLSEVGDRTRSRGPGFMLRLYERYLESGSERDRRRLLRAGCMPPERGRGGSWQ